VANKEVAGYGTWKRVWKMEDDAPAETRRRRAEEERGWRVSNKWLTIITTPLPVFIKVFISKGLSSLERTL
jgi:8-oxo-dGTP pyrophosphatase MutT (NUDIX family)